MSNQHALDNVPTEARQHIIALYKQGLGIERIAKQVPQGIVLVRRILKEAGIPRMQQGNQVKFKPICPSNKVCPACRLEKTKEEFGIHCANKDGLRSQCKTCRAELERPRQLMRKYGITVEEYDRMFEAQNGICACCGQPETAVHWKGKKRTLAVDHNHQTGKVRQLICHRCNIVIGLLKESPDLCELVRQYVLNHKER